MLDILKLHFIKWPHSKPGAAESTDKLHRKWGEQRVKHRASSSFLLLEQVNTSVATAR